MSIEFERKWLVPAEWPMKAAHRSEHIRQVYVYNSGGIIIRVRAGITEEVKPEMYPQKWNYGEVAMKGPSSTAYPDEYEMTVPYEYADKVIGNGPQIRKMRFHFPQIDQTWKCMVDVFEKPFDGLVVAEVEFTDEDVCALFEPPNWFGREVTHEKEFKNANLMKRVIEHYNTVNGDD